MNKDYIETLLAEMSPCHAAKKLGVQTWELRLYMRQNGIEYKNVRSPNKNSLIKKLINHFEKDPSARPIDAATYIGCNRGLASTVKTVMDEIKRSLQ